MRLKKNKQKIKDLLDNPPEIKVYSPEDVQKILDEPDGTAGIYIGSIENRYQRGGKAKHLKPFRIKLKPKN